MSSSIHIATGRWQRHVRHLRHECAKKEGGGHLWPERASRLLRQDPRGTEEPTGEMVPSLQGEGPVSIHSPHYTLNR